MENSKIRCQKCRHVLLNYPVFNMTESICNAQNCNSYNERNFIHLQDDKLPLWIKAKIESEEWTKGKLHCENCGFKVGSFDFISGKKCECGKSILPPVHFITSQVDRPIVTEVWINKSKS